MCLHFTVLCVTCCHVLSEIFVMPRSLSKRWNNNNSITILFIYLSIYYYCYCYRYCYRYCYHYYHDLLCSTAGFLNFRSLNEPVM